MSSWRRLQGAATSLSTDCAGSPSACLTSHWPGMRGTMKATEASCTQTSHLTPMRGHELRAASAWKRPVLLSPMMKKKRSTLTLCLRGDTQNGKGGPAATEPGTATSWRRTCTPQGMHSPAAATPLDPAHAPPRDHSVAGQADERGGAVGLQQRQRGQPARAPHVAAAAGQGVGEEGEGAEGAGQGQRRLLVVAVHLQCGWGRRGEDDMETCPGTRLTERGVCMLSTLNSPQTWWRLPATSTR